MVSSDTVIGPFWGGNQDRRTGRFPLSVERHVVSQVAQLLPGVTAVTPNARYFTLHAVVADEVGRRGLVAAEAQELMRRAEVVMAAITMAHGRHGGMSAAHGADRIGVSIRGGTVDVAALSKPGGYAESPWGFWGPYRGSETLLGLTHWEGKNITAGPGLPMTAMREALGPVITLASHDQVEIKTLHANASCCICGCANAADGELLRSRLLPSDAAPQSNAGRRAATIKMMLRIFQLREVTSVTRDMWPVVAYDEEILEDPVCGPLEATLAWRGVVLRSRSVMAWRDLWAKLVNEIHGLVTIADLADTFAAALPDQTVSSYMDGLPDVGSGDALLDAEEDNSVWSRPVLDRSLALLFLGAARVESLPERVAAYFEGPDERRQGLTPAWIAARTAEWKHRSIRDFARWLTEVLVVRSQRIALRKARFNRSTGTFQVPERVFLRDGLLFRDSTEFGGPVGFRWDPLSSVLVGAGLSQYIAEDSEQRKSLFRPTPRAMDLLI